MKKIIITGAGGYIGCELVKYLSKKKYKIIAIDRYFFGEEKILKRKNIKLLKDDIRNLKIKNFKKIYAVIDLAALSNDITGEKYVRQTFDINFKARYKVAQLAKKAGVEKYILPSSCSNYGRISKNQIADEKYKLNPLTNYSKANTMEENKILKLKSKNFFPVILRQGTVYGFSNRLRLDLVVNRMTYEAFKNNRIPILKDGSQRRPTLHIIDAIRAMHMMIKIHKDKISGEIFNVGGDGNNLSINQLAKEIKSIFKKKIKIFYYGEKDLRSYFVSFKKIKSLGYKTLYKPKDGAKQLVKMFKKKKIIIFDENITLKWYDNLNYWNDKIRKAAINNKIL